MSDVFVSYKAEDRSRIEPLVQALEAEGLSVWWDARVSGGQAWRETIAEQLDAAPCVIVVWSKRSTGPEGRFVRDEANHAQHRATYLPVTIDKVLPPLGFGETQALPLNGWKGDPADPKFRALSACVHAMLGRDAPGAHVHQPRPRVTRRTALAAGGGAALVAAGAGGWFLLRPSGAQASTIAVLPFANLSGDRSDDYFSDGLAEEVRAALSAIGGLQVVARTSSEILRNADAVTAAQKLSVANVVTGSVRRSPSTVRVSTQLVDGRSGLERWSQTFDRPLGDVLKLQSDIAANVARALSIRLGDRARAAIGVGGTTNPQAQDLMFQATAGEGDDSSAAMLRRIALAQKATDLDPRFAEAYARKGLYQDIWASTWAPENVEKARAHAEAGKSIRRAIDIAPNMPLAQSALGIFYSDELQLKRSLAALSQSINLPGADSGAFLNAAVVLARSGRQPEAASLVERAISLDPLNPVAWQINAWILFYDRRYSESIEAARHTLELAPQNLRAQTLMAWDYILLGNPDEARRALDQVPADDYRRLVGEGALAARAQRKDGALQAIQTLTDRYGDTVAYQKSEIYAQVGDSGEAVAALDRAWATRDAGLASVLVDPFLDPIRSDPRFKPIASRLFA